MIRYELHQRCKDGLTWHSSVTFEAQSMRHVRQAVVAGFIHGEPRWATNADTGETVFGLGSDGKEATP